MATAPPLAQPTNRGGIKFPAGIEYNAHLQDIGWQGWRRSGDVAGTTGESRRMEAIRIRLTGSAVADYDVYYRAHVQDYGWQDWVKNGNPAGTVGASKRMEAIQIRVVRKGSIPDNYDRDNYNRDRYNRDRYDRDNYNRDRYERGRYDRDRYNRW